jgi:hypothetical protein
MTNDGDSSSLSSQDVVKWFQGSFDLQNRWAATVGPPGPRRQLDFEQESAKAWVLTCTRVARFSQ